MRLNLKNFFLDILFPAFCLNCQKQGSYLCEDCCGMLEISGYHQIYQTSGIKDLYFAVNYQNPLIKNLIQQFKYEPFIKELAKSLSCLIINHFQLLNNKPVLSDFILIPVPLDKKRLKWRGFNQAEEVGKELYKFFNIPLISDCLIKIKQNLPQIELSGKQREENTKGVFLVKRKELIIGKKIVLVDDIYTTGSTMQECARVLKSAGAKEIIGMVIARG